MSKTARHAKGRRMRVQRSPIRLVDRLVYAVAIVEPLFSLPQAYQIYHDKAAANVSVLSWLGFELLTLIWLWYGIVNRDMKVLLYQGLFFIIDGSVLVGAIHFQGHLL